MRIAHAVAFLLVCNLACGVATNPTPSMSRDMAVAPQPSTICTPPPDSISRLTPEMGYWAVDNCRAHCLPPQQMFSICTERRAKYLISNTMIAQKYAATWEIKTTGCPELPWRVWELVAVPWPSDAVEGKATAVLIQNDCSAAPLTVSNYFTDNAATRRAYIPIREVLPTEVE